MARIVNSDVFAVLLGRQSARPGELRVVRGAVDVVPPGDDHLVVAGEEPDRLALEVLLGERLGVGPCRAASPHPDAREGGDVRPTAGVGGMPCVGLASSAVGCQPWARCQ